MNQQTEFIDEATALAQCAERGDFGPYPFEPTGPAGIYRRPSFAWIVARIARLLAERASWGERPGYRWLERLRVAADVYRQAGSEAAREALKRWPV